MTKLELQKWNTKYPDGSPCATVSDDGILTATTTKTYAWFSAGVPVVRVGSCSEPYPISRLRMADRKKLPHAKCLSCAPPLHRPDENIENYAETRVRIRTLADLSILVDGKKAVYLTGWNIIKPAAFVINLSGIIIYRLLTLGIYIYEKPKPKL